MGACSVTEAVTDGTPRARLRKNHGCKSPLPNVSRRHIRLTGRRVFGASVKVGCCVEVAVADGHHACRWRYILRHDHSRPRACSSGSVDWAALGRHTSTQISIGLDVSGHYWQSAAGLAKDDSGGRGSQAQCESKQGAAGDCFLELHPEHVIPATMELV